MEQCVRIHQASVSIDAGACLFLKTLLDDHESACPQGTADVELSSAEDGLHLRWNRVNQKCLDFHLDYVKSVSRMRSFPEPKQGAFNQAIGKRTRRVIDATGGWGFDALLMCMQGYEVLVWERHPLMASLLREAFARLSESPWARSSGAKIPFVIQCDAIKSLEQFESAADCVYLDPMFPAKRKKSANASKQMQFLQWLVGEDADAAQLVQAAVRGGYSRIVVKRPDYAMPLLEKPNERFSSKLVHYDVYLNH